LIPHVSLSTWRLYAVFGPKFQNTPVVTLAQISRICSRTPGYAGQKEPGSRQQINQNQSLDLIHNRSKLQIDPVIKREIIGGCLEQPNTHKAYC